MAAVCVAMWATIDVNTNCPDTPEYNVSMYYTSVSFSAQSACVTYNTLQMTQKRHMISDRYVL